MTGQGVKRTPEISSEVFNALRAAEEADSDLHLATQIRERMEDAKAYRPVCQRLEDGSEQLLNTPGDGSDMD